MKNNSSINVISFINDIKQIWFFFSSDLKSSKMYTAFDNIFLDNAIDL